MFLVPSHKTKRSAFMFNLIDLIPHLWFNFFNFGALPNCLHYITRWILT